MSGGQRPKSRWLTGLFAAVMPGGGHLYLGWYGRGLMILLLVLLDLAALVRFSDATSGSRALLLLYLGYALPALYFFSVFDALEISSRNKLAPGTDSRIGPLTPKHSIMLVLGGLLLFFLIRPTEAVQPRLDWIGDMASGVVLLALAVWMGFRTKPELFRLGRFSAGAVIAVSGFILLWDQVKERNDIGLLSAWWPLLFVLAGVEMLVFQLLERRKPGRRLAAGTGAVFAAIVLVGSAYLVTQYGGLPFRWLDQYAGRANLENLSEEKGFRYSQEPLELPLESSVSSVVIDNPNGDVRIQASSDPDSRLVTVQAELWVDTADSEEADTVSQKSKLKLSADDKLEIAAQGMPYGANGSRLPRYNLIVTVPADLESSLRTQEDEPSPSPSSSPFVGPASATSGPDNSGNALLLAAGTPSPSAAPTESPGKDAVKLTLQAGNGSVSVAGLTVKGGITLGNRNGSIELRNIVGPVQAETSTGDITAAGIKGDAHLTARDGGITASRIEGELSAVTSNGNLDIAKVAGKAILETKNGFIQVEDAEDSLQADTLNGQIRIRSSVVGGNWTISSSIGEVKLSLPKTASFEMDGAVTFGAITSELPLEVTNKTVEGILGLGTHRIRVDANSDIAILAYPATP